MPKFYQPTLQREKKHSTHPLFAVWYSMHFRCENERSKDYLNYGGRGIKVCERWNDFLTFVADMGPKPSPAHTLERSDNDGNYDPFNCVWATRTEQNKNRRSWKKKLDG